MLPPIHDKIDCDVSAIAELVPLICPLPSSHVYAPEAVFIWEWQPLEPQLPSVPLAR
jgi:hypothetical protein